MNLNNIIEPHEFIYNLHRGCTFAFMIHNSMIINLHEGWGQKFVFTKKFEYNISYFDEITKNK